MGVELSEIIRLPVKERIKLVEDIWDSIAAEHESIELTSAQKEELDRRIKYHQENPEDSIPWETVRDEALARK
jgi:putative addiction module component (TIGR02574 family)